MAERLALLRPFELYAHEAAELDQAKNFQRKVSSTQKKKDSEVRVRKKKTRTAEESLAIAT